MIKRLIKFFDRHRLLLIILILILVVILFFGIKTYFFFYHQFTAFSCTEELNEEYCYYQDIKIFVDPEKSKETFFKRYQDEIEALQENYNLDNFNNYTAYYYQVAASLQYETNSEYKILKTFFETYSNTYNLEEFYFKNTLYFDLFYNYKIN